MAIAHAPSHTLFEIKDAEPGAVAASILTTSVNDSRLARACWVSAWMTASATRAALRGTPNQGAYAGLGLQGVQDGVMMHMQ